MQGCRIFICICLCQVSLQASAQFKTWPLVNLFFKNQFDNKGMHHGRWSFYTDAIDTTQLYKSKGKYKHGAMVGAWKTYSPDKVLRKMERGTMVDTLNIIETTEYYSNGKIFKKGVAVKDYAGGRPRYYLSDNWQFFKEDGSKEKDVIYEEGWPVKTTYANGEVVISKAPPRYAVYKKGDTPVKINPRKGMKLIQKGNETLIIRYLENGDSTVTVSPMKINR